MALAPINYILNTPDPAARTFEGLGQGIAQQSALQQQGLAQQAAQQQAELHPLQVQAAQQGLDINAAREARAQQQFGIDQQAAQQQADRRAVFQAETQRLIEMGAAASSEDYARYVANFPELSKGTAEALEQLDESRRKPLVSTLAQAVTAIGSGNVDVGIEVAERFADAARNSGDVATAEMAQAAIDLAKINPDAAYMQIATLLQTIDPDLAKQVVDNKGQEEPASVQALRIRASEAGLEPGSDEYRQFMLKGGAEKGMALEVDPDGTVRFVQGGTDDDIFGTKPPTEGQLASAGYLQRMTGAEETFGKLLEKGIDRIPFFAAQTVGTAAEGLALNGDQERLLQAQRDWVRAKLRKESGAVIGPDEMADEIRTYFPQPGETSETVAQKRVSRERAVRQMEITAGKAAPLADDPEGGDPEAIIAEIEAKSARGEPLTAEDYAKVRAASEALLSATGGQ